MEAIDSFKHQVIICQDNTKCCIEKDTYINDMYYLIYDSKLEVIRKTPSTLDTYIILNIGFKTKKDVYRFINRDESMILNICINIISTYKPYCESGIIRHLLKNSIKSLINTYD